MTSFRNLYLLSFICIATICITSISMGEPDRTIDNWGGPNDYPLVGDFDKDGHQDDLALFKSGTRCWEIDLDADGRVNIQSWTGPGQRGDRFAIADLDWDGFLNDVVVITPDMTWTYYTFSYNTRTRSFEGWVRWPRIVGHSYYPTPSTITWGVRGDLPVAGDFDYDGHADDIGVFRPSNRIWYFDTNLNGTTDRRMGPWGRNGDLPIAGDFDGDRQFQDMAVFRPASRSSNWYYDYSSNNRGDNSDNAGSLGFELSGDLPLVGDFDGQGLSNDIGIYRPSSGQWLLVFVDTYWSPSGMQGMWVTGRVNA